MGKNWHGFLTKLKFCYEHGKPSYDKRAAQTARNKRWEDEHIALRIYPCPDCNGWHLTHLNPYGKDGRKDKYN